MVSSFDVYYSWLGIPPALQPPHLYRLLGLSPFESDPEVIENAARLRAHFLTRQLAGPHPSLAQQLLEEIEHATGLLLDHSQRQAYDDRLKHQAQRDGRPVDSFDTVAAPGAAPRRVVPPHLEPAARPPETPTESPTEGTAVSPAAIDNRPEQGSIDFSAPLPRRRTRTGRGWQVSLLVLLMFLPAHGLLLWIGYQIAYYKEDQAGERPTEIETVPGESGQQSRATPPATVDVYRWPRYGISIQPDEAAVWEQAASWFDWKQVWTVEIWLRHQSSDGFQPIFGLYPGAAFRRSQTGTTWRGWVLGVYPTEPGREELRLIVGQGNNRRMTRLVLPATADDLVHVCLVCDGSRATICWNGKPLGVLRVDEVTNRLSPEASFWVGNSPFLPEPGRLKGEVLGLRVSSVARYDQPFQPAPNWEPDRDTQLLPDFDTLRTNASTRRSVIDRSDHSHRGDLLGASWIKWDEP